MNMNANPHINIDMYFGSDGFSLWTLGWFLGTTSEFLGVYSMKLKKKIAILLSDAGLSPLNF